MGQLQGRQVFTLSFSTFLLSLQRMRAQGLSPGLQFRNRSRLVRYRRGFLPRSVPQSCTWLCRVVMIPERGAAMQIRPPPTTMAFCHNTLIMTCSLPRSPMSYHPRRGPDFGIFSPMTPAIGSIYLSYKFIK